MKTKEELNSTLMDRVQDFQVTALEVELLLALGADIHGRPFPPQAQEWFPITTPLDVMLKAQIRRPEEFPMDICKMLIDAGSNVENALSILAVSSEDYKIPSKLVQMLIDAGADPTAQSTIKFAKGTILDVVVRNFSDSQSSNRNNIEFAKILVESGAQLNTEITINVMEKLLSKIK